MALSLILANNPEIFIFCPVLTRRECSSGVEHDLAKVGVEGSNPFTRSIYFPYIVKLMGESKIKISEGMLIALIPAIAYALAYFFEIGYLFSFGLTEDFITVSIERFFVALFVTFTFLFPAIVLF